ncbi:MAG: hypothetical protein IJ711_00070 [Lachnospiraceae bacterium]|nr:hypothetical protein [Clostridia bacterium]MBR1691150.1 hypothetical protein [Lachnospiraceae bacterium]
MKNKDYFEIYKDKEYPEKLRAFGMSCEQMVKAEYESARTGASKETHDYYSAEYHAQLERVEWLFEQLKADYLKPAKKILRKLHEAGGCDAVDDRAKGWDEAISEAISIVEEATGVSIEEVLNED